MIHPVWPIKLIMGTADQKDGELTKRNLAITENKLLRLVFHDCIPYMDGTGIQREGRVTLKNFHTP